LATYYKIAIDANVLERQLRMAEHHGVAIGNLLRGVLGDLKLSEEHRTNAPAIVRRT
jgi:hypothetical protein